MQEFRLYTCLNDFFSLLRVFRHFRATWSFQSVVAAIRIFCKFSSLSHSQYKPLRLANSVCLFFAFDLFRIDGMCGVKCVVCFSRCGSHHRIFGACASTFSAPLPMSMDYNYSHFLRRHVHHIHFSLFASFRLPLFIIAFVFSTLWKERWQG